jgi:alkylhydroperoxidase family enzyme
VPFAGNGDARHAYDAAMAEPEPEPQSSGPRLVPLAAGEWDQVLTRVLEGSPGGTTEPMHIFTTLGRADPELFRRWLGFGGALLSGTLPGRLRELVILRTAYRFGGGYEWAHHIELAEAQGITREEIAALGRSDGHGEGHGKRPGGGDWSPVELAALRAVDETAREGAVSDATWEALEEALNESEIIELLMLIAHYQMLTGVLRSLRVDLEPSAVALARSVPGGPELPVEP